MPAIPRCARVTGLCSHSRLAVAQLLAQAPAPWQGRGVRASGPARRRGCRPKRRPHRRWPWSASPSPTCSARSTSTPACSTSPRRPTTSWPARRYEELHGVFGARIRVVRLRLGEERLQLTEYLAPRGRPAPADARSNDRWFQHVAIIVSDMDRAYARLRRFGVQHASTGPQTLPKTIPGAAGIRAFYFRDPDGHPLEILQFPPDKGDAKWHRRVRPALPRHRPHRHRGGRHRGEPRLLPRRARVPGGRREPQLRHRAGAPQQRARRAAPDHRAPRGGGARRRVPRVSRPDRRPAVPRRRAGERSGALADHDPGARTRPPRRASSAGAGSASSPRARWRCPTPPSASGAAFGCAIPTATSFNS